MHDTIWIVGMLIICVGFGGLITYEFIDPHADLSADDGLCRIGIVRNAAYAIIGFDTAIGVALNVVFVFLLWPVLKSRAHRDDGSNGSNSSGNSGPRGAGADADTARGVSESTLQKQASRTSTVIKKVLTEGIGKDDASPIQESVRDMFWRNLVGSTLISMITIANGVIFIVIREAGLSYVCLLTCLTDSEFLLSS